MSNKTDYKVKITGPGHTFDRAIDEVTANAVINFIVTGVAVPAPPQGGGKPPGGIVSVPTANMTPKQFMALKRPGSNYERVACLGYFLANNRNTPQFKTEDIIKLNTEAAQTQLSNASLFVRHTASTYHYLSAAGAGKKQMTALGEALVEALPDRARVAEAIAENSQGKKKKRSRRKKKKN